jgi:murein DD-endopeptidase MepM/ murein hydrolase activator NlpD
VNFMNQCSVIRRISVVALLFCLASKVAAGTQPVIQPPAGFGHYCSLKNGAFGYGNLDSDPCATAADSEIAYAGLWDMNGINRAYVYCTDGFKTWAASPVAGPASLDAAFAATTGHPGCKINVSPKNLPIFRYPWLSSKNAAMTTSRGVDLALHGQRYSRHQLCSSNPPIVSNPFPFYELDNAGHTNWNPEADQSDHSGYDWVLPGSKPGDWGIRAVAAGKVIVTRARDVGKDKHGNPWTLQNEVYVRHVVAKSLNSRYREEFISYYAHLKSISVSVGAILESGQLIGPVGDTGAGASNHLHLSVFRLRNVRGAWKSYYPFGDENQATAQGFLHDGPAEYRTIDPFGWNNANCIDAWGYYSTSGRGAPSIRLWRTNLAPPGWNHSGH